MTLYREGHDYMDVGGRATQEMKPRNPRTMSLENIIFIETTYARATPLKN